MAINDTTFFFMLSQPTMAVMRLTAITQGLIQPVRSIEEATGRRSQDLHAFEGAAAKSYCPSTLCVCTIKSSVCNTLQPRSLPVHTI
jgi:hypothetical protein